MITNDTKKLSANLMKLIAISAMLIDHIAWAFVPFDSVLGQIMHFFGRITCPIMCFFIAEGFYHTRNIRKYLIRLTILAIISHFASQYFISGKFPFIITNGHIYYIGQMNTTIIYSLILGLISLIVWNSKKMGKKAKISIIIMLCIISTPGDYSALAVLFVLFFGIYRGDLKKQMLSYAGLNAIFMAGNIRMMLLERTGVWWTQLCRLGVFLAIPLFFMYNGELGKMKNFKWVFYAFYPIHLIIIGIFRWEIFR